MCVPCIYVYMCVRARSCACVRACVRVSCGFVYRVCVCVSQLMGGLLAGALNSLREVGKGGLGGKSGALFLTTRDQRSVSCCSSFLYYTSSTEIFPSPLESQTPAPPKTVKVE